MTYTVKNGTWCKDNDKEYYSTTEVGLKAALKAGEITAGTRVVVHKRQYPAASIIQSLNPEPPEGFMVPDGSAIDPVYEELIAIIGPNLPDLREYVLVCAGQNSANIRHDVFAAGEAKQDQAQLVEHTHDVTDPGHDHGITDPGHSHGPGTFEITGSFAEDSNTATNGAFHREDGAGDRSAEGSGGAVWIEFNASRSWEGKTEVVETNVTVDSATTGITVNANGDNNVTRTKQFGVYYYIAF